MKNAKKTLAALLVMVLLCGFAALGVSAADAEEPELLTDAQMEELTESLQTNIPLAFVELALQRVPSWLNWAVFAKGSSYEAMEAEVTAELAKSGYDAKLFQGWLLGGEIMAHGEEIYGYNKLLAEKGPDIIKKHCAFYIDWLIDGMLWVNKLTGGFPLFA